MSTEQTEAIVLRMVEFSETSLIVTLYGRDLGRVSAIAKGARRPKGPFEGALDLLSICRVVVITKSADVLDLLTEAKLQRRFRAGERSLVRLHCGYYVAELLRVWTDSGSGSRPLYDLAVRTIEAIDGGGDALLATLRFELAGLRILGHGMATSGCVSCGGSAESGESRVPFAYHLGGVLCQACRLRQRDVASVRREVLGLCEQFQEPESPIEGGLSGPDYRDLRGVVSRYVMTQLGMPLRTQSMLPTSWVSH